MPRHANLPFHLYVHVDNRALGPKLPPGTTAAIWHAVYARPGQVVMAHVLLETGAEWCGVPLHQIVADPQAFGRTNDAFLPMGQDLQPWGAMGECIETVHMQYLEGLLVMGSGAGPGFTGRHTGIVIDWADGADRILDVMQELLQNVGAESLTQDELSGFLALAATAKRGQAFAKLDASLRKAVGARGLVLTYLDRDADAYYPIVINPGTYEKWSKHRFDAKRSIL